MTRLIAILCALLMAQSATAQEVLGRALIEGRNIAIFDDGTWEYTERGDDECDLIARNVSFCGENAGWEPSVPPNADVAATYRFDDRHYGQMIIEGLGTNDGLTAAAMRDIVIQNAAAVIGGTTKDIAVLETYLSRVSGQTLETIVYALAIDGLDVVYANGIFTSPDRTMQLMTFAIGTEFTARHRELHDEFLSEIRLLK